MTALADRLAAETCDRRHPDFRLLSSGKPCVECLGDIDALIAAGPPVPVDVSVQHIVHCSRCGDVERIDTEAEAYRLADEHECGHDRTDEARS